MTASQTVDLIHRTGLVAIVRAESPEQALRIAEACREGGCGAIEITFTVPRADRVIERLADEFKAGGLAIGAGTVLDPETARIAILAGAEYLVSPYLNPEVVRVCRRYDVACLPGAMTVREVVDAMECGADLVKLFPGEVLGPAFVKAVRGPLPQARLVPTGGVSVENVGEWIRAGAAAVGVGGNLTAGAKTGDYGAVTATARAFAERIAAARAGG
ncbi:MAG TPA: bifunctional 2-keto-4-hydroxyglutarate aldolase/2-keto-3-deoxy-6-phosphogluconate aldolase [Chthonomonadales bacterium]|nr:bifunctional 2-keto-4-hydroxyglutarate aldolase/2-keto-3-deoxy-6-phosphogluconate aldolase [Chthonomonadales bacterium]